MATMKTVDKEKGQGPEMAPPVQPGPRPRTAAQTAASRSNGARSTGPRTVDGKKKSRWNSLKHGVRSLTCRIRNTKLRNAAEYRSLVADLAAVFRPENQFAMVFVEDAAEAAWQLTFIRRLSEYAWFNIDRPMLPECDWDNEFITEDLEWGRLLLTAIKERQPPAWGDDELHTVVARFERALRLREDGRRLAPAMAIENHRPDFAPRPEALGIGNGRSLENIIRDPASLPDNARQAWLSFLTRWIETFKHFQDQARVQEMAREFPSDGVLGAAWSEFVGAADRLALLDRYGEMLNRRIERDIRMLSLLRGLGETPARSRVRSCE